MARYRHKDKMDLLWNAIRTTATRELDTKLKIAREAALNEILTKAWEDFNAAIDEGKEAEIEAKYADLAQAVVDDILPEAKQILEGSGREAD